MIVKNLIEKLKTLDPEAVVIIYHDGKGFKESNTLWSHNCSWNSEDKAVGLKTLTYNEEQQGYGESDIVIGSPAIVFF